MSTQTPVHLPCGECGRNYKGLVAVVINLPKRPDLHGQLMRGALNVLECPHCGHRVRFLRTVATIDFERQEWVYGFPETLERYWQDLTLITEGAFRKNMRYAAPPFVRAEAPRWAVRTVLGYEGLREARVISDAGLDDVAVEIAKLHLLTGRPRWAGSRLWLRAVDGDRLLWRVKALQRADSALVETGRSALDAELPDGLLPGALGADSFVSFRRYFVTPVHCDPDVLNIEGRWDTASGAGDPKEPLIRL